MNSWRPSVPLLKRTKSALKNTTENWLRTFPSAKPK